ncbi:MAG TPA: hypothetical protein DCX54_00265 [Flavobacteriales bacterium]|nr:hypothetical protein [Flavobacteriales bacterium]
MQALNLPSCELTLSKKEGKTLVFDELRKKYVVLTPEEWVRQHFIRFLIEHKKYPGGLISIEKAIVVHGIRFRTDTVVYNTHGTPKMLIEFKAPTVEVNESTLFQIAKYNKKLDLPYLLLSNGMNHYCFKSDENGVFRPMDDIPDYSELDS